MLYSINWSKRKRIFSSYQVNICADAPQCGAGNAGCGLENGRAVNPVGVEKTLDYSTDGIIRLTYKGPLDSPTGDFEAWKLQSGFNSNQRLQS